MANLRNMVVGTLDDVGFERFEAEIEMKIRNEAREIALREMQNEAARNTRRAKLRGWFPMHKDILVNADGDAVAWYSDEYPGVRFGTWVFDNPEVNFELNSGRNVKQQYYDHNDGTAEWVASSYENG